MHFLNQMMANSVLGKESLLKGFFTKDNSLSMIGELMTYSMRIFQWSSLEPLEFSIYDFLSKKYFSFAFLSERCFAMLVLQIWKTEKKLKKFLSL